MLIIKGWDLFDFESLYLIIPYLSRRDKNLPNFLYEDLEKSIGMYEHGKRWSDLKTDGSIGSIDLSSVSVIFNEFKAAFIMI